MYGAGTPDSLLNKGFNLRMLDGLIDRTIIWQGAVAEGLNVEDSTVHWYTQRFIQAAGGVEQFDNFVKSAGISRVDVEQIIRKDLAVRDFLESEIYTGIQPNDSVARAYYDSNPHEFTTGDSVRARHIILRASAEDTDAVKEEKRKTLRDLRARISAGESFAELAKQFSQGPSGPRGGDLGTFTRSEMVSSFSDAAFALEPGQMSDVVETQFGYHLILVEDKMRGKKLTYEEVRTQLIQQLQQYMAQQKLQNHLQRNKAVAIIERNF
jgi:peptidyl-prolyl cis-trans isomerase C